MFIALVRLPGWQLSSAPDGEWLLDHRVQAQQSVPCVGSTSAPLDLSLWSCLQAQVFPEFVRSFLRDMFPQGATYRAIGLFALYCAG
jgi:hypothetical protein